MATILLIDDDAEMLAFMARTLRTMGHAIAAMTSGIAAISYYQSQRPHLTIIDVWMPGQDGFETMRAIRKIECFAKIIICSGHPSYYGLRVSKVASERGATAVIDKPFEQARLVKLVNQVLEKAF